MGQLEKLLEKMRRLPPEMRYEEVGRVLRAYGFIEERATGSHHIFRHSDGQMLTVPKYGGQVVIPDSVSSAPDGGELTRPKGVL